MEIALALAAGIALSAATGFRIFVPFLVMSVAAFSGHLDLAPGFEWIGTYPALIAFAVATVLEIGAYYVPWLDNLLDSVATPAAVVAGTLAAAAVFGDMSPFMRWTLAAIAGGGAAGMVQAATVLTRGASSVGTGGIANPILATGELTGSAVTSVMAVTVPVLGLLLVSAMGLFVFRQINERRSARSTSDVDDRYSLQEL